MDHDLTADQARAALADATSSAARLRQRARWASTQLQVLGLGMGAITVAVGLIESKVIGAAVFVAWGVLALVMHRWSGRRSAHLTGTTSRTARYSALSFALYGVAIAAGGGSYGDPTYWVPAAVLVAVPMLVGAFRERRA